MNTLLHHRKDKDNIFRIVREGVGFHRLNCVVLERVRDAVLGVMETAAGVDGVMRFAPDDWQGMPCWESRKGEGG